VYDLLNLDFEEQLPLAINIYNRLGALMLNVMDSVLSFATGSIIVDIDNLISGQYSVVFQYGNYICSVPFIKQ
jgi:hypothetical protein